MDLIDDFVSKFIEHKTNEVGCSSDTILRYKGLINVYKRYLSTLSYNQAELISYFTTVTSNDLFEALSFYIRSNKIQCEDTCNIFISVIKSFYRFLFTSNLIKNSNLIQSFDHNMSHCVTFSIQYQEYMDILKKKKIIKFSSQATPLDDYQIKKLVIKCNEDFSNYTEMAEFSPRIFHKLIKIIQIKLVILTGASQRVITNLTINELNINDKTISINGVLISVPQLLTEQIKTYLDIRKKYYNDTQKLFLNANGALTTGFMGSYLGYVNDEENNNKPGSVIGISKYTIIRMLQNGIGHRFIQEFTDYKETVIESCQEYSEIGRDKQFIDLINNTLSVCSLL